MKWNSGSVQRYWTLGNVIPVQNFVPYKVKRGIEIFSSSVFVLSHSVFFQFHCIIIYSAGCSHLCFPTLALKRRHYRKFFSLAFSSVMLMVNLTNEKLLRNFSWRNEKEVALLIYLLEILVDNWECHLWSVETNLYTKIQACKQERRKGGYYSHCHK